MNELIVVALGGNALARRGQTIDVDTQRRNLGDVGAVLARVARRHALVVTHGNGPQIGLLALQNDAYGAVPPYPLDVLGAETEGMIGYLLEGELDRHLPAGRVATLLTQVVVDRDDPELVHPTKPIGPRCSHEEARELTATRRWRFARDGHQWRRVVPSPQPRAILELPAIRVLLRARMTVVCAGGGGIPVVRDDDGPGFRGVAAVIDKDLAAALLASELGAARLVLLTDVDAVYDDWGTERARPIKRITPQELREVDLPAGSMGPKAEAACRFVAGGGALAVIGSLDDAPAVIAGEAGTVVTR